MIEKKWFIRVAVFFLPVLLYGILGESFDFLFFRELRELHQERGQLEVLISGTSQTENSVIACQLSTPAANLAFPQKHHHLDKRTIEHVLETENKVNTIVIELSYEHFELPYLTRGGRRAYLLKYFEINTYDRPVYPWDRLLFSKNPNQYRKDIIKWRAQLFDKDQECNIEYLEQKRTFDSLGYDESKIKPDRQFFSRRTLNDSVYFKNTSFFRGMISDWIDSGLRVVIIIPPKHPIYHMMMNPEITYRRDTLINSLRRQYPQLRLLDRERDTVNFVTRDFRDQNHLNDRGAIKFTKMLDSLLLAN